MLCLTLTACKDTPLEGYWVVSEAEIYGKKINIDEIIRAVTMSYDDLVHYGSEKAVKEAGRLGPLRSQQPT